MVEEAERRGELKAGMTIVEATGGSTGASLAFVSAVKGYRFLVACSDAFSKEKLRTISSLGAEVNLVHSPSGKFTADLIPSIVRRAEELSRAEGHYYTNQFHNNDALIGYATIGHELTSQFSDGIDAFCGAVGTAGMVTGVARVLRSKYPSTKIVVLEPAESPLLTE
ncbi:cysteine synthase [Trichoderma arundinaceum]|uniref:Cysteine synthase n=1 Tax=Trichoderma arundinaceum TaxID=490622 RepID=A0A395NQZ5_TRIAR|nr:cysteine synthase [Trichoderma arundinaceum]